MAGPKITLFFDTVSPFAYEAYFLLRSCDVTYIPIFLGGLMKACENKAPIAIKNKDKWINTERLRWAKTFSIPITTSLPPSFPPLTLPIMRALCALQPLVSTETFLRTLNVLYAKYWVERVPTHQVDILRQILIDVLGNELAARALSDAATVGKKRLAENTDSAFAEGAFGVPWMTCTDDDGRTEGFWGVDHLGQVATFLGLERSGTGGWKSLL